MNARHFWLLLAVLLVLLSLQTWWTYELTVTYGERIEHILANQIKIMAQYEEVIGIDRARVEQNKEAKEALEVLQKNDRDIIDKCVKLLGKDHN